MKEHENEFRVGVTLTIAGVILVVGMLWLAGFKFNDEQYNLSFVFPEVAGLGQGDKVTVAGLDAGEVLNLELLPDGRVAVDVEIEPHIRIPVDSRISVASYGLIGSKVVQVRPGQSDEVLEPGATAEGIYDKGLGDVVSEMGEALTEIRSVLAAADELLSDEEGRALVRESLENANEATGSLKLAVEDLRIASADLREFIDEKRDPAASTIDSLEVASAGLVQVSRELQTVSTSLDSIISRVERGEGTLGRLVTDEAAHDEFLAAVREVRLLVEEIKRNPKSFVKFSLF
ncbi:MAG: MCE family protein [Candidatus Eisenbacteria bacterium]|nr:MCE family protein [Candidatus Eisenbacteria bacterium]